MTDKFSFTESVNVVLWEQDPNDPDDRIDTMKIPEKVGTYGTWSETPACTAFDYFVGLAKMLIRKGMLAEANT